MKNINKTKDATFGKVDQQTSTKQKEIFHNLKEEDTKKELTNSYNICYKNIYELIENFKKNSDSVLKLYPKCAKENLLNNKDAYTSAQSLETLRHIFFNGLNHLNQINSLNKNDIKNIKKIEYLMAKINILNFLVYSYFNDYLEYDSKNISIENILEVLCKNLEYDDFVDIKMSYSIEKYSQKKSEQQIKQIILLSHCLEFIIKGSFELGSEKNILFKSFNKNNKYYIIINIEHFDENYIYEIFNNKEIETNFEKKTKSEEQDGIFKRILKELGRDAKIGFDGDIAKITIVAI